MAASGKRPAIGADRLSDLPNCLLHSIMSLLPTRQAVQMCELSRRWEDLWCSVPCLDIDEQEFLVSVMGPVTGDGSRHAIEKRHARFEEFVTNLLMFHSAPLLDRLRIDVDDDHDFKFIDRWIRRGIRGCPEEAEIRVCSRHYGLPRLSSGSSRLKRLQLAGTTLDSIFTGQLTSSLPVLEDLLIEHCYLVDTEITSCTLKNLIVRECHTDEYSVELTITAPALAYLQIVIDDVAFNWVGFQGIKMSAHVKATICIHSFFHMIDNSGYWPHKLLCSLTNVRHLTLTGSQTLAVLHTGILASDIPVFHNLRTLLFEECDLSDNFKILGFFLNNAPTLEKLILQCCQLPEGFVERETRDSPKTPHLKCQDTVTFNCPYLKWTEIKYKDDVDAQKLFDILLTFGGNLRKNSIVN